MKQIKIFVCLFMLLALCVGCQSEPKQISVLDSMSVTTMTEKGKVYTVGDNLSVSGIHQITEIQHRYDTVNVEYNESGLVTKVNTTDNDDGKVGYETFTYTDNLVSERDLNPNDGFRYLIKTEVEYEFDADGRVVKKVEYNTKTDLEDNSVSTDTNTLEYAYNELGQVEKINYYIGAKLDHTTTITYDENGNITVYSNSAASYGEYMRIEFTYKLVDESTVENVTVLDPFIYYMNLELLINHIL